MNLDIGEQLKKALIDGFKNAIDLFWGIGEVRELVISSVVGFVVYIISFKIVGLIMAEGRKYDIWFGRIGGKILYKIISIMIGFLIGIITYRLIGR